jgi:hypothetical protein
MSIGARNDAAAGFRRLNDALLRPGDIILTTTTAAVSMAIRVATGSDISHAMVCVEDRSVIDATGEGVQARNTQDCSSRTSARFISCGCQVVSHTLSSPGFAPICAGTSAPNTRSRKRC